MKITFIQTGKTTSGYLKEGICIYHERIHHYVNFEEITIPDLKNTKNLTFDVIKNREGELIIKNLKATDYVILLDEKGKISNSLEFAEFIQKKIIYGKDIVFVIGGAYGFSQEVYKRSNELISLSKMTFSHQMVRLIFAEQLYRAMTIIKGEPYHHN